MQITQTFPGAQASLDTLADYATGAARLLLVTSNTLYRRLLPGSLVARGFAVTLAESAVGALRLRQGGARFELLVVDIDLADMDALAFARTVRAGGRWSELPLVAMSICPESRRRRSESAAGFRHHVAVMGGSCLVAS